LNLILFIFVNYCLIKLKKSDSNESLMKTTNIQLINENNILKKHLNTFTVPIKMNNNNINNETQMPTSRSIRDKISNLGESIGNISARILNDNININNNHISNTYRSLTTKAVALNELNSVRSIV
jgi:hypothetical protein